jgi:ribonuclease-3
MLPTRCITSKLPLPQKLFRFRTVSPKTPCQRRWPAGCYYQPHKDFRAFNSCRAFATVFDGHGALDPKHRAVGADSTTCLDALQQRIAYNFRASELLVQAVTHSSFLPEHPGQSNQRLEFLGDAVLQVLLAEELFRQFADDREGPLTRRRALLVNGMALANLAREIELGACLRLGVGEESSGGRTRASVLGDAFEALTGALYLDSDLDQTRRVVLGIYGNLQARLTPLEVCDNPKGRLLETVQPVHGNSALRFTVLRLTGEDHAPEYEASVHLFDRLLGTGIGRSKKLAEEAAAKLALATLDTT